MSSGLFSFVTLFMMLHSHMIISVLHMLPYSHLIPLSNLRVRFFGKLSSHLRYRYIFYGKQMFWREYWECQNYFCKCIHWCFFMHLFKHYSAFHLWNLTCYNLCATCMEQISKINKWKTETSFGFTCAISGVISRIVFMLCIVMIAAHPLV